LEQRKKKEMRKQGWNQLQKEMTPEMKQMVSSEMGYSVRYINMVLSDERQHEGIIKACEILIDLMHSTKNQFEVMVSSESLVS
jgi:peroxiredoxin family protein